MSVTYLPLGSIARVYLGVPTKTARRRGSGELVDVLTVRALEDGDPRIEDLQSVRLMGKVSDRNQVWPGDVLLPSRSTSLKVGIVPPELGGTPINSTLIGIRCLPQLDPRLLAAYFNHPEGQAQVLGVSQSGTDQLNITASALAGIEVPLPSLDRQTDLVRLMRLAEISRDTAMSAARLRHELAVETVVSQMREAK